MIKRYLRYIDIDIFDTFLIVICSGAIFTSGFLYANLDSGLKNKSSEVADIYKSGSNRYIRFIFIGSSDCGFSNRTVVQNNVISLKEVIDDSTSEKIGFISTGISIDSTASPGIKFLQKTGPYDEVVAGGDMYNVGITDLIWSKERVAVTPRVMILIEKYDYEVSDKIINRIDRKANIIWNV